MSSRGFLDAIQLLGALSSIARKNANLHGRNIDLVVKTAGIRKNRKVVVPNSDAIVTHPPAGRREDKPRIETSPQHPETIRHRPAQELEPYGIPSENLKQQTNEVVLERISLKDHQHQIPNHLISGTLGSYRHSDPEPAHQAHKGSSELPNRTSETDSLAARSNADSSEEQPESGEVVIDETLFADLVRSPKVLKSLRTEKAQKNVERNRNDAQKSTFTSSKSPPPSHNVTQLSAGTPSSIQVGADNKTSSRDQSAIFDSPDPEIKVEQEAPELVGAQYQLKESRVPSTRLGRLWQYGGLATSMAFGAVGESFRRVSGSEGSTSGSIMLSGANMERLVSKLSRMRGAALKLGQMISFQDIKMLPGPIQEVLQRVQDSADFMPAWQRDQVLASNLGSDWRELFSSFEEVPMAAASIGQVHGAVLKKDGMHVAVKIQYPGVAKSIDSDLSNLASLLVMTRLLPKGLYLDKTIENSRTELAWECDYEREAKSAQRFSELLADDTDVFVVPRVITEASSSQVLTLERMGGSAVTKLPNLSQEQKDWVATNILRLCLRELFEFHFMQTDPNWTNFLYNTQSNKIELLDFGASRDYPAKFVGPYTRILEAAARQDRATIVDLSVQLGYLTGHESRVMRDAHTDSVLTLAEPFSDSSPDCYDFRDQTITDRVRALIPVMLRERLAPPPEETYSLHRKLSGAFLLCARLGSRVRAKELFRNAVQAATPV